MKKSFQLLLAVCAMQAILLAGTIVRLQEVATDLTRPVQVTHAGDGSGRIFVIELRGSIRIVENDQLQQGFFLDLTPRVLMDGEGGLLSMAFHPNFSENRRFFCFYVTGALDDREIVVEEFQVSENNPNFAPAAGTELLRFQHPDRIHFGGQLAFGPDGFLYISVGDGGPPEGGPPGARAQDLTSLHGKILRIDVDSEEPYAIPSMNPFVGIEQARGEIYAFGFRNPWRFSFDRMTGQLLVGDVGENRFEEINRVRRGGNYGWNLLEGPECFIPSGLPCPNPEVFESPLFAYPQTSEFGRAVTGGFVYRGSQPGAVFGNYVFADFVSGRVWLLEEGPEVWTERELGRFDRLIPGMGEDEDGELYLADFNGGNVFRLEFLWRGVLAQVADGGSANLRIFSRIEILNASSQPAEAAVRFLNSDGGPLSLEIDGAEVSEVALTLEGGQLQVLETSGREGDLKGGWVEILAVQPLNAYLSIGLIGPSDLTFADAGFLTSPPSKRQRIPVVFSQEDGAGTALAVVNPALSEDALVRFTLRDSNGDAIDASEVELTARRHFSAFIQELFSVPESFEGVLEMESDHDLAVTVLRTRNGIALFHVPSVEIPRQSHPDF